MTVSSAAEMEEPRLPRRDWFLMPLISLSTICLLALSADLLARRELGSTGTGLSPCLIASDPATGVRAIPKSVCWEKIGRSERVDYKFNSCGMRADRECGPKARSTFRIVAIGSSFGLGDKVNNQDTFASILPAELSQQTGRQFELYNEGILWGTPHSLSLRFNATLRDDAPDLILWTLTPWDIENATTVLPFRKSNFDAAKIEQMGSLSSPARIHLLIGYLAKNATPAYVNADIDRIRFMLEDVLYQSQSQYVKAYLMNGADEAGFLKAAPNAEWQARLKEFDGYASSMEERASSAGVPLVVVLLPNRAQAAMVSMGEWPVGYDPYKLDDELRDIVTSHGSIYIDILPSLRDIPNAERDYRLVDGHPDARGHAMIAQLIARQMTSGAVPAIAAADKPQPGAGRQN